MLKVSSPTPALQGVKSLAQMKDYKDERCESGGMFE